ncbi:MAG TPA: metal-dependent hydrolase [Steroidobacteraceae bacterium]
MHVATHLLMGWTLAEHTTKTPRDRALVAWASVVPDLDGLGLLVDAAAPFTGGTMQWYDRYHHMLLHGLPGAVLFTAILACFASDRLRTALLVLASYHLHLLGDLLGSRGGAENALWPIHYLAPFSDAITLSWQGQWPLTSWQNTALTMALMAYAIALAIARGRSPVGLFSRRADEIFVQTLRHRFAKGPAASK